MRIVLSHSLEIFSVGALFDWWLPQQHHLVIAASGSGCRFLTGLNNTVGSWLDSEPPRG